MTLIAAGDNLRNKALLGLEYMTEREEGPASADEGARRWPLT